MASWLPANSARLAWTLLCSSANAKREESGRFGLGVSSMLCFVFFLLVFWGLLRTPRVQPNADPSQIRVVRATLRSHHATGDCVGHHSNAFEVIIGV
jgi:hypothetical protein